MSMDKYSDGERTTRKMRLARILLGTWLVFGGLTACSDHNPTVVFVGDAAADGKSEAGSPQDSVGGHDGGGAAEVVVAVDAGGPLGDVPLAVDLPPEANPVSDVANLDVNRAVDLFQAIDLPTALPTTIDAGRAIDGPGQALDGPGGTVLDLGADSSAAHDGDGIGG
jgi:hypothetical protein